MKLLDRSSIKRWYTRSGVDRYIVKYCRSILELAELPEQEEVKKKTEYPISDAETKQEIFLNSLKEYRMKKREKLAIIINKWLLERKLSLTLGNVRKAFIHFYGPIPGFWNNTPECIVNNVYDLIKSRR